MELHLTMVGTNLLAYYKYYNGRVRACVRVEGELFELFYY